jgi:hypothetical protein
VGIGIRLHIRIKSRNERGVGVVIAYSASSRFSGAADFPVCTTPEVPIGTLNVFIVAIIMFAYGLVHLL